MARSVGLNLSLLIAIPLLTIGFAVDGTTNPCAALEAPPLDGAKDFGGLPEGTGRETVFNRCAVCHSIRTVTQQRLSRSVWEQTLDWMVEEQGMASLDQRTRETILDYLSKHYGHEPPR